MSTLDTASDFIHYLARKEALIRGKRLLFAPGEEELLAFYLQSKTRDGRRDFVFPGEESDLVCLDEGEWRSLVESEEWAARHKANLVSYAWDRLIEQFNKHILGGTSPAYAEVDLRQQESVVRALAGENRLNRRALALSIQDFLRRTRPGRITTRIVMPPSRGSPHYLFIAVSDNGTLSAEDYRRMRRGVMNAYSLAFMVEYPNAHRLVILGLNPVGDCELTSMDAMYCDVHSPTEDDLRRGREIQEQFGFLTKQRVTFKGTVREIPQRELTSDAGVFRARRPKSDRNSPCSCGSGKKYKKCCLRQSAR